MHGALLTASCLSFLSSGSATAEEKNPFRTFHTYQDIGYDQLYRPLFHFTSLKNWINDPNGLMYYDGEYHLFFQHNPLGNRWGNMTWGHAVSTDMVHWKQLPHAITPYGNGYVFSGTGVVDHNNSLGKQVGDIKTLVIMYSYAVDVRKNFGILTPPEKTEYYQGLAYSTDKGRTFTLLNDGGPVIPFQGRDIDPKGTQRDPKLFWHEPSQKWVTILWMGETSKGLVRIFTSDDLQNWTFASDMTRSWAHECFDLVHLTVHDDQGKPTKEKKWLIYDGSFDYEVGSFDGKSFTADQEVRKHKMGDWNAAQTFNHSPDGRTVIMAWLTSASFHKKQMPFAEQLTFPATMHLRKDGPNSDNYQLYTWPIKEIESLHQKTWKLPENSTVSAANAVLKTITPECSDITIEFEPKSNLVLDIRGSKITYNAAKQHIHFISKSNTLKIKDAVNQTAEEKKKMRIHQYVMPNALIAGSVKLRILVDRGSFEIFLNDGKTVLTHSEISELDNKSISLSGGDVVIKSMVVHELKSSWPVKK
jgi:fructan beta-fructosidase